MPDGGRLWRWAAERRNSVYLFASSLLLGAAFIALVYSVKWKYGVALVGFFTILAANLYSLQLGILPVFLTIPMDRLGKLGAESVITWAKLLIGVLIVAFAIHVLLRRDRRPLGVLIRSPLFLLAILTLSFSILSVINARDYEIFLAQNARRMSNLILFILIVSIVDSKVVLRRIFVVFLIAYFFVGLTVLYEIVSGNSILAVVWGEQDVALDYTLTSGEFRVGGPGGDPDFLAISVIFPSLVGLTVLLGPGSRLVKLLLVPLLLELMVALLATGSRGGLGAFLIGATIVGVFSQTRHKLLIGTIGATVLVIAVVVLGASGAASTQRFTGEAGGKSLVYRLGWTEMALMMIEDHPFVGVGTGNFPKRYSRYSPSIPTVPRSPYWTHNSFLQTWAENGVFAFMCYVGLYLTAAALMLRVIWRTTDPELRRLAALMLAAVCAFFFFAGTSNILENENYWIVFSLVTVVATLAREREAGGGKTGDLAAA